MAISTLPSQVQKTSRVVGVIGDQSPAGAYCASLLEAVGMTVLPADRCLTSPRELARVVSQTDTMIMVNQGRDQTRWSVSQLATETIETAWAIVWSCEQVQASPRIVFSGSERIPGKTSLEEAARTEALAVLRSWARRSGSSVSILPSLPNGLDDLIDSVQHSEMPTSLGLKPSAQQASRKAA